MDDLDLDEGAKFAEHESVPWITENTMTIVPGYEVTIVKLSKEYNI